MTVHLVHLKSSGETWHTAVCEDHETAVQVMAGYGIRKLIHAGPANGLMYESQLWQSETDPSQTASVVLRDVVRAR